MFMFQLPHKLPKLNLSLHITTLSTTPTIYTQHKHNISSVGLVGLPNVGKSTLFNALTSTQLAQASNYPFTTIEPNKSYVAINDPLLNQLATVAQSQKIVTAQIEFVDIAGLVKNASTGAGLGNQFLSNIRSVDMIIHMIRCYHNDDIIHVDSTVDPLRDMSVIETELLLSDIQVIEKKLTKAAIKSHTTNTDTLKLLEQCNTILNNGHWIVDYLSSMTTEQQQLIKQFNLITSKPIIYVCNVDDNGAHNGNELSQAVKQFIDTTYNNITYTTTHTTKSNELVYKPQPRAVIHIAANLEAEASATFDDLQSRTEYLAENQITVNGLDQIVGTASKLLKQHKFYTIGPEQAVSWTIPYGATALVAAGKIHTDIAAGFISCDVIKPTDYIQYKGESGCKQAGKIQIVGKEYVMQDGDIVHFKFNKTKR